VDFDHDSGSLLSSNTGFIIVAGTGGLQVPTGTTAQRPATAGFGTIRINSSTSSLEFYNNSTWQSFGVGVTSVALTLPSIFSVSGSPITTAGTLTATLTSQSSNTVLAAPSGSAGTPAFRALSINDLSNVAAGSAVNTNLLSFNGTNWVPTAVSNGSASGILSSWTSIGGTPQRWTQSFTHGLGTFAVVVSLFDSITNQLVLPDSLQLTSANAVLVTVASNTRSLRIVVVANGQAIAAGGSTPSSIIVQNAGSPLAGTYTAVNFAGGFSSVVDSGGGVATITAPVSVANAGGSPSLQQAALASRPAAGTAGRLFLATDTNVLFRDTGSVWTALTGGPIRTLSYVAAALDTPNSSDWVVNSLAPGIPDASFNALTVRQFSNITENGVGLLLTVPVNATVVTVTFKARAAAAVTGATNVVQPRMYRRQFPNGSAPGAWNSAVELANIPIPASSTNFIYSSQTLTLASLGWTAGQMTLVEVTRRVAGVTGGTNLAALWNLAEIQLDFQ